MTIIGVFSKEKVLVGFFFSKCCENLCKISMTPLQVNVSREECGLVMDGEVHQSLLLTRAGEDHRVTVTGWLCDLTLLVAFDNFDGLTVLP